MDISDFITATTCEALAQNQSGIILKPKQGSYAEIFSISDPFGLRQAIVPVLMMGEDQVMRGMGTAFHVDGWGTFITADHVLHIDDPDFYMPNLNNDQSSEFTPVLLLGMGVVFGTVGVPPDAIAVTERVNTPIQEKFNPLNYLKGKSTFEAAVDIAFLYLSKPIPTNLNKTLPIAPLDQHPKKGDIVVAIGFPELKCNPVDGNMLHYLLEDGMSASYGKIIDIHPHGRGSTTPIIEVESNWPSGMSGGPVLNVNGEVIGIVSKSLQPDNEFPGNGSAVCLSCLPQLDSWLPTIEFSNIGWRKGWAVLKNGQFNLTHFYKNNLEAATVARYLGPDSQLVQASNKVGTDQFIIHNVE